MSTNLSQKEATFNAITKVLAEAGIGFEVGVTDVKSLMTRELRSQVSQILLEGFKSGSIQLGVDYSDSGLRSYVSNLQTNYLTKDKRLNGNKASDSPAIRELRKLIKNETDPAKVAEMQQLIKALRAGLNAATK